MKKVLLVISLFVVAISYIDAQTFFSPSLNKMFVGPDNVQSISLEYRDQCLATLDESISVLQNFEALDSASILAEKAILIALHESWNDTSVNESDKNVVVVTNFSPGGKRKIVYSDGTSRIINQKDGDKWLRCTPQSNNCLSANPVEDCLLAKVRSGELKYYDDYDNLIPYAYFYDNSDYISYGQKRHVVTITKITTFE